MLPVVPGIRPDIGQCGRTAHAERTAGAWQSTDVAVDRLANVASLKLVSGALPKTPMYPSYSNKLGRPISNEAL